MYVYLVSTRHQSKVFLDFNILCNWLQFNAIGFHLMDRDILFSILHRGCGVANYRDSIVVKRIEVTYSYPNKVEYDYEKDRDDDFFGSTD